MSVEAYTGMPVIKLHLTLQSNGNTPEAVRKTMQANMVRLAQNVEALVTAKMRAMVDDGTLQFEMPSRRWVPLREAKLEMESVRASLAGSGIDPEEFVKESLASGETTSMNDVYTVIVRKLGLHADGVGCEAYHLSIRRNDRLAIHDWRDFQKIKNQLVGAENEAVEIYPAESRLVDEANSYHLWCAASVDYRFPMGFSQRTVGSGEKMIGNAKQRAFHPLDEPEDVDATQDVHATCMEPIPPGT